jgi:hypothetical protein
MSCATSLVAVASRPARVADRLITAGFRNTSTRGFASPEDMTTAVCFRPGTEIAFDHAPKNHRLWRCTAASNVARPSDKYGGATTHHDALEFSDGTVVPVTQMLPGNMQRFFSCQVVLMVKEERWPIRRAWPQIR